MHVQYVRTTKEKKCQNFIHFAAAVVVNILLQLFVIICCQFGMDGVGVEIHWTRTPNLWIFNVTRVGVFFMR